MLALNKSPLYAERIKNGVFPVIGEGAMRRVIMFVGEAPGKAKPRRGGHFPRGGQDLNELLVSVGINRPDVYITNIVKERPAGNRDPLPEEITIYGPFLDRQINIIQPRVIATLGRFSMEYIMRKFSLGKELKSISQIHGTSVTTQASYGLVDIVAFYHPAASIYNQQLKETLFEDFKILLKIGN